MTDYRPETAATDYETIHVVSHMYGPGFCNKNNRTARFCVPFILHSMLECYLLHYCVAVPNGLQDADDAEFEFVIPTIAFIVRTFRWVAKV